MQKEKIPSLEELLNDFSHPNPNIYQRAYLSMIQFWPKESIRIFTNNLSSNDIKIRRKSIAAIAEFGESIITPISEIFIENNNTILRISCLKILVKVVAKSNIKNIPLEVIKVLKIALEENAPEFILVSVSLLRQFGNCALDMLFDLCQNDDLLQAKAALTAVSEINDPRVKTFLVDLLKNESLDSLLKQDAINLLRNYN
tara:strand:- start:1378 stop:1977 length:600 start_codon:yes stop_codon:yes gene_type:complete